MRMMRSVALPTARSWVTISSVRPRSTLSRRSSAVISSALALSRSPVGSSAHTIAGSLTSARAIVTRWRSPPESSSGTWRRAVGQADQLERLERAPARLGGAHARDEQRQLDVLDRRQDRHQVVVLEDEAHPARAVVGALAVGHGRQGDAFDHDVAAVDGVEAGEAVQQRGLAAAARPHDGDHLAARRARGRCRAAPRPARCRCHRSCGRRWRRRCPWRNAPAGAARHIASQHRSAMWKTTARPEREAGGPWVLRRPSVKRRRALGGGSGNARVTSCFRRDRGPTVRPHRACQ